MPNRKCQGKNKPKENQISNQMKPQKFRENIFSQGEKSPNQEKPDHNSSREKRKSSQRKGKDGTV